MQYYGSRYTLHRTFVVEYWSSCYIRGKKAKNFLVLFSGAI